MGLKVPMLMWWLLASAWAHPADGNWEPVSTPDQADLVQRAAIDAALSSWPAFIVAIARPRILKKNLPCSRYVLGVNEDAFSFGCGDFESYLRPLKGVHLLRIPDGDEVRSKLDVRTDGFRLRWEAEEGRRVDTFEVEGDVLHVRVSLSAPALPRAIRWTLDYRRVVAP
jgi:hypothetical protein